MAKVFPTLEQMEAEALERMPLEKRLKGISTQELLQRIPTQERLEGIPTEELFENLSAVAKQRLRKRLEEENAN